MLRLLSVVLVLLIASEITAISIPHFRTRAPRASPLKPSSGRDVASYPSPRPANKDAPRWFKIGRAFRTGFDGKWCSFWVPVFRYVLGPVGVYTWCNWNAKDPTSALLKSQVGQAFGVFISITSSVSFMLVGLPCRP